MKLLLLASVICFAAVLAAPADKQKREILPGDPRYGTDQHHHHHHEHENEVQISKAAGGYVGSFSVPDKTKDVVRDSYQVPKPSYGPPNHTPGDLIKDDFGAINKDITQVPATSYGIPDTQLDNNHLASIADKTSLLKVTIPKTEVHLNPDLNIDYQAPLAEAPITSYSHPDIKTISEQPKFDTVHVHKTDVVVPQVKVTGKLSETQVLTQPSIGTGSLPSFTSFNAGNQFPLVRTSYPTSYPTSYFGNYRQSFDTIPIKTVDHHVRVQVPQPYPVPVTKHVTYRVPVPHTVEVPKPYQVRVPYPVQVPVDRPYPVEVPRAVPYPVPHYIRTSVPVVQSQYPVTTDVVKANPIQTFFENTASTFQDTIGNLPSFTNPLQNFPNLLENFPNFQNPFENFQLPSFTPAQPTPTVPTGSGTQHGISLPTGTDAVTIENPTIKTIVSKPTVVTPTLPIAPVKTFEHTVKATTQKEYVQPTDSDGGYVY